MVKNNMKITVDLAMSFARFEMGLEALTQSAVSGCDTEITAQQLQEASAREEYFRDLRSRKPTKHDFEELDGMQFFGSRCPPRFARSFGLETNSRGFALVVESATGKRKVKHIHDVENLDGGFVNFEYMDTFGDICFNEGKDRFVRLRTKITARTCREMDDLTYRDVKELYMESELAQVTFRKRAERFYNVRIKPFLHLHLIHKLDIKKIYFFMRLMTHLNSIDSEFFQTLPDDARELIQAWSSETGKSIWMKLRKIVQDENFATKYGQIEILMNRNFNNASTDGQAYLEVDTKLNVFREFFKQFAKNVHFWRNIFKHIDTGRYPPFRRFLALSRRFLRRDQYSTKCSECDEAHFGAFMVGFFWSTGASCSKRWCRECFAKRLTETLDAKKNSGAKSFAGEEPHRGVFLWERDERQLMARVLRIQWPYLALKTGVSVEELKMHHEADFRFLLDKPMAKLEMLLKNTRKITDADLQKHRTSIHQWRSFQQSLEYNQNEHVRAAISRCTDLLEERRAGNQYAVMKQHGLEAMEHRAAKAWDDMYDSLDHLLKSAASFQTTTTRRIGKEHGDREIGFGLTLLEWSKEVLDQNRLIFDTCFNTAKRCQVCMNTAHEDSEEYGDMILPHVESEFVFGVNNKMPCTSCRTCFSSFLKHSSAIGKPMLKCPGMGCAKELNEKHVAKVAPKGLEEYRFSLMRFSLKQCHNFKFCPNTACGEGFAVPDCCASTEKLDRISCPKCAVVFCPSCNGEPHGDVSCLEHQKGIHKEIWGALGEEEKFMKQESKQCPFCLVWIEKNGGCNHMTCRHCCGEFCWICGGDWKMHNQGSKCGSDEVKIHRKALATLYPFKRFPTAREKKLSESEKFEADFHTQLAYQSFIQGFEDEWEEFEEVQVWELDPTFVEPIMKPDLGTAEEEVLGKQDVEEDMPEEQDVEEDVLGKQDVEEDVSGKQDVEEDDDLADKIVCAELFLTSNFTVEMQDSLAVTPIQMEFENDSGSESGENMQVGEREECVTPEKRAPETKCDSAAVSENAEDVKRMPEPKRTVKFNDAVDLIPELPEKATESAGPKYVVRYHKKKRFDVITQMNYFQFIQGFHTDDGLAEPCEDVKIQA